MVLAAILLVVALVLAVPFLYPTGIDWLNRQLGGYAPVPLIVTGVGLFAIWVVVTAKGYQLSSWGLYLASLGIVALLISIGLSCATVISGSSTAQAYRRLMPMLAPLAVAAVCFGFTAEALRRGRQELKGEGRRVVFAIVLFLLALCSFALGVRVGRVDLPLPRLGAPFDLVIWRWF